MDIVAVFNHIAVETARATPTPHNPWIAGTTEIEPPVGWTIAGLLLILLAFMVYVEIRKFVRKVLKKKAR